MPRARSRRSRSTSATARRNRAFWEATAPQYEATHRRAISGERAASWGMWRIPESKLHLLGNVRGRRILELGCGGGHWAVALTRQGATVTGLDFSLSRLTQARSTARGSGVSVALVEANAERLPFRSESFDLVFCDWGAMTFADPHRTVPEAARVLRPGGRFAFSNSSPFRTVCQGRTTDRLGRRLLYDYFGLHRVDFPEETDYQLTYGDWIDAFGSAGLLVERLIETRPPARGRSSYLSRSEAAWARRWPIEVIWQLRKAGPSLEPPA